MSENFVENQALVCGQVEEQVVLSHVFLGKEFYKTRIRVERLSGTPDYVPVVSNKFMADILAEAFKKDKSVKIEGELRTRNMKAHETADGKSHLMIYLFPRTIEICNQEEGENANTVQLEGTICKPPIFRETPLGRKITDLCMAVGRTYGRGSSYIPCIAWGMDAEQLSYLEVGTKLQLTGRIQSRTYFKETSKGVREARQAYEVSVKTGEYNILEG